VHEHEIETRERYSNQIKGYLRVKYSKNKDNNKIFQH